MSDDKPDWVVLMESVDEPLDIEQRAHRIADVLESGLASQEFLKSLAAMIRPGGKANNFLLQLRHKKTGRPKGPNWAVAKEMVRLVDEEGVSISEAHYQVQRKFGEAGNSRSACLSAMKEYRELEALCEWHDRVVLRHGP